MKKTTLRPIGFTGDKLITLQHTKRAKQKIPVFEASTILTTRFVPERPNLSLALSST